MKREILERCAEYLQLFGLSVNFAEPNWKYAKAFPAAWIELDSDGIIEGLQQQQVHRMKIAVYIVHRTLENVKNDIQLELLEKIEQIEENLVREQYINGKRTIWKYTGSKVHTSQDIDNNFTLVGAVVNFEVTYHV